VVLFYLPRKKIRLFQLFRKVVKNALDINLENVSAITIGTMRAGIRTNNKMAIYLKKDNNATIHLTGKYQPGTVAVDQNGKRIPFALEDKQISIPVNPAYHLIEIIPSIGK
jgi:hypothetical protein